MSSRCKQIFPKLIADHAGFLSRGDRLGGKGDVGEGVHGALGAGGVKAGGRAIEAGGEAVEAGRGKEVIAGEREVEAGGRRAVEAGERKVKAGGEAIEAGGGAPTWTVLQVMPSIEFKVSATSLALSAREARVPSTWW